MAILAYARTGDACRGDGSSRHPAHGSVPRLHGRTGRAYGADRAAADEWDRNRERSGCTVAGTGEEEHGGVEGMHLLPSRRFWIAGGSGGAGGFWKDRRPAGGHRGEPL